MKALFLSSRFPYPPDRGDRVTSFNLLRALSARHAVTLLSFIDGSELPESQAHMSRYCERIVTVRLPRVRSWAQAWLGLFSPIPSQVSYYSSRFMSDRVKEIMATESFDVVVVHLFRMAPFVYDLAHPAKVLLQEDSMGVVLGQSIPFAPLWKRPGIAWERWRVNRYMAPCSRHFRETWAVSPGDQRDLTRLGCTRVELVRHGMDERLFDLEHKPAPEPRLMFLGNLSVFHNIDAASFAAREIWPPIHREWPKARLILAGANPVPEITRLASIEGVEVTGRVPDLTELWQSAHVFVAPIRFATGIQNKLLEAMAAGVPVVSTSSVAEALGTRHGEHMLLGDTTSDLVQAVAAVLRDPEAARKRAERAREYVRGNFTWEMQVRRLEALVGESSSSRLPEVSAVGE